jgi:hypothetical protein
MTFAHGVTMEREGGRIKNNFSSANDNFLRLPPF